MSTPVHYSISVYSAKDIAARYERNHFSDEIGQYIHEQDISAIARATPSRPELVADIGTGTGRIASGLRQGGIGLHPRIIDFYLFSKFSLIYNDLMAILQGD